jgi:hypothetical protein
VSRRREPARTIIVTSAAHADGFVRLSIDVCYPMYDWFTDAQRQVVEKIVREMMHPDLLRRQPRLDVWASEYFDEYLHLEWMREVGKIWFVMYLQTCVDRMGRIPDDGGDE